MRLALLRGEWKEVRESTIWISGEEYFSQRKQMNVLLQDGDCLACWRGNHKASVTEAEQVSGESVGEAA